MIPNCVYAIKGHHSAGVKKEELTLVEHQKHTLEAAHIPNAIASNLYENINELYQKKVISGDQFITLDKDL